MDATTTFLDSLSYLTTNIPSFNQEDVTWMLAVGFVFSFILAFGLGANDVANSFATSVGAKVLTLRSACILASIFETGGAVLLGSKVSDTIRKGIFDVTLYEGREETLMMGQVAALGGAMIWLLVATLFKLPVSGTHSIVGAMIGFHVVVFQFVGINWKQLIMIVGSWFISPLMSGVLSAIMFAVYRYFVLQKDHPLKNGLRSLPVCYAAVMFVNVLSIFLHAPQLLRLDKIPVWGGALISVFIGFVVGLTVWLIVVPRVRLSLFGDGERPKFSVGGDELFDVKDEKKEMAMQDVPNGNCKESSGYKTITGKPESETNHFTEAEGKTERSSERDLNVNNNNGNSTETSKGSSGYTQISESPTNRMPPSSIQYEFKESIVSAEEGESRCWPFRKSGDKKYYRHTSVASSTGLTKKRKLSKRDSESWKQVQDPEGVAEICGPLQILSALFASFAHGGNDVSNAIGPLIALWVIFQSGSVEQKAASPIWILLYGGIGMTIGLWVLGRRVIETVGSNLTPMTPSSGFTIELGAATTVLLASNLGIPVSTTHCKVGSIVAIGYVRSRANVEWKLFRSIILAWIVTVPSAALLSAGLMWIMLTVTG
ncbi:Sodium-dependent phosphate transporter 2 [Holothuria leucospilota]|uniref:Phosphate transporter n=1 Tax=Holothuria leucospilota TaxID=206669 RepID=A0A9Q1BVR1_HOLLE|nr:Sodium-dependent phosphate transporter 2 [Holothuria leucospilota]